MRLRREKVAASINSERAYRSSSRSTDRRSLACRSCGDTRAGQPQAAHPEFPDFKAEPHVEQSRLGVAGSCWPEKARNSQLAASHRPWPKTVTRARNMAR